MLYRIGLMILLFTTMFMDSENVLIPLGMAVFGIALMMIGGTDNGKTDTER